MGYISTDNFRLKTLLPLDVLTAIETRVPGWLQAQIDLFAGKTDTRLTKRYAVPFVSPYPLILEEWTLAVVSWRAYLKRGVASTDEQAAEYKAAHDRSLAEIEEAANSETGLFELPLRADAPAQSGVTRGFPRTYSEQSPYVQLDRQLDTATNEDGSRRGSGQ